MAEHHPVVSDRKVAALRQAMGPVISGALADRISSRPPKGGRRSVVGLPKVDLTDQAYLDVEWLGSAV